MTTVSAVANATEIQLLCLTYKLFLDDIKEAIDTEGEVRKQKIANAKQVLGVLTDNLDLENPIGNDLFKLYVYIQNNLINHMQEDTRLQECHDLMMAIYKGYEILEAQQADSTINQPSMANAQKLYAGMTYGKGYLNEITMDEPGRGFKA